MKTSNLTSTLATLCLVLFMSIASIANSSVFHSGELHKSGDKSMPVSNITEMDFSYLRFDVAKFVNESEASEAINYLIDLLRFDVNDFINESDGEAMDLKLSNEFEYLRFDANNFTESDNDNSIELPVNELTYLRFDVNNFVENNADSMIELPVNGSDYLRFDVNNFITAGNNAIDELPVKE